VQGGIRQPNVSVWCHVCGSSSRAELNLASEEYECTICHSDCVEHETQGVDAFYAHATAGTNRQRDSSGSGTAATAGTNTGEEEGVRTETDQLIQQILDRILSFGPGQTSNPSLFHVLRDAAVDSGRPVGIIVRQPGGSVVRQDGYISGISGVGVGVSGVGVDASGGGASGASESSTSTGANRSIFNLISSWRPQSLPIYAYGGGGVGGAVGGDEMGQSQLEEFLHHILMNSNAAGGAPPAPKQLLEALPRTICEGDSAALLSLGECCITQELFEAGDCMVPLPCGHNYKQEAILHWLEMHNACPVCRVEVKL
jgi:hypothetical protein